MLKERKKRRFSYQRRLRAAFDLLEDRRLLSVSPISPWSISPGPNSSGNAESTFALSKSALLAGSANPREGTSAATAGAGAVTAAFNPTVSPIAAVESETSTDAKPQSKTWTHDGHWFSVFADTAGTHVWRLDGLAWTKVLTLSTTNFKADVKSVGDVTHVLLFKSTSSKLASIQYKPATSGWELWSQRTSLTNLSLTAGAETATIDIDSTGRMWAVSDATTTLEVRYSDAPYRSFSPPIVIASGIGTDDIAGVIALPNGTMGVFWSNQITKRFGFRTHQDGASPDVWSADEVPAASAALNVGSGMADDHMSIAVATDGTLYAAVKTSYDSKTNTTIGLLIRRPSGVWDQTLYPVTIGTGTRPSLVLDELQNRLIVAYRKTNGDGPIVYKDSSTSSISFGTEKLLIAGIELNDASSTKQNITNQVVFIAAGTDPTTGIKHVKAALLSLDAVSNVPPVVNAGPDLAVAQNAAAVLDATVTDDGLPAPPAAVTTTWTMVSGPGTVTFGNASAVDTTATFSAIGTYLLRLEANDGQAFAADEVTVTVAVASAPPPTNSPIQQVDTTTTTEARPQSKVWTYGGRWFSVFADTTGTHVWRLDALAWTKVFTLSTTTTFKAEVKSVGDVTHILLFKGATSKLASIQYKPATSSWEFWSQRPSLTALALNSGAETGTIDIDSTGRMWAVSDASTTVEVRYSDAPYTTFSAPITLASGIASDDITDVVALPNNTIGVMWSNQNSKRFGFVTHQDGASPDVWSADEVPGGSTALNVGGGLADNHISLAVASNGTVFAAVKTRYEKEGYAGIGLLVRRPSGVWDAALYPVTFKLGARPIVVLNEQQNLLVVAYRAEKGAGPIVYKVSSMSSLSFSPERLLIDNAEVNDVSSTRQDFTSDIVFIAGGTNAATGTKYVKGAVLNFASNQTSNNQPVANALDTSRDGAVTPLDALLVINALNGAASSTLFDVNGDGSVTPLDSLLIINYLNEHASASKAAAAPKAVIGVEARPQVTQAAVDLSGGQNPFASSSTLERDQALTSQAWLELDELPAIHAVPRAKHVGEAVAQAAVAQARRGGRLESTPHDAVLATTDWDLEV